MLSLCVAFATSCKNRLRTCDVSSFCRILLNTGRYIRRAGMLCVCVCAVLDASAQAAASDDTFVVGDIRVEGLLRISEGTVYNYLPVAIGDRLDRRRVREAIRALYGTGFFQDVELRRDGGTLIVALLERPSIERFEIKGNKEFKTEDLQRSLRGVGLAPGKSFDRSVLDEVERYLTERYYAGGKYAAIVDARIEGLPNNQVAILVDIKEGGRARIRQINIVGNAAFSDEELLAQLELSSSHWLSWYEGDDRYGKELLNSDIEKLRSYYMDRGYADFHVSSTQVAISPEKSDIFITINVEEGRAFLVSEVKFAGNLVTAESELRRLVQVTPGSTYSQKLITQTVEAIKLRLGIDGYAFATVDPVHSPAGSANRLAVTLVVEPGHRVYVRRVNFSGTTAVNDEVLRREMRQLEGAYLSNVAIERSKYRIQRLPYIAKVEIETTPVAGTPDLVDVNVAVEDGLPGQFGGAIGYSQSQNLILSANAVHTNFLGTGERLAFEAMGGESRQLYQISHTDPFVTLEGVSRTLNLQYSKLEQLNDSYSDLSTETYLAGLEYSYPVSEVQRIAYGASVQHIELLTSLYSSEQLQDWVRENGDSFFKRFGAAYILGTRADIVELSAAWLYDSRDRLLFPRSGAAHRLRLTSTVPDSPIEFLTASYHYEQLFSVPMPELIPGLDSLSFSFNGRLSYAKAFGDTTAVPPNRQFFTGGPNSVRGFDEDSLGPRDSLGNPYGGDASVSGQLEAILPLPHKLASSARLSLFFDFGQSFHLGETEFRNRAGGLTDYDFDLGEIRTSTGIAVQWLSPLGLFRFSYALPLRKQDETRREFGDEIVPFQFSVGSAF